MTIVNKTLSTGIALLSRSQPASRAPAAPAAIDLKPRPAPIGPEVSLTVSARPSAPVQEDPSVRVVTEAELTPQMRETIRMIQERSRQEHIRIAQDEARKRVEAEALEAEAKAKAPYYDQLRIWYEAHFKACMMTHKVVGIPDHKSTSWIESAGDLEDLVAAQQGLAMPASTPGEEPTFIPNKESMGAIGIIGSYERDNADYGNDMYLAFDREFAADVTDATFTFRESDGQSALNGMLDRLQRFDEEYCPRPTEFRRFDLVDGSGRTVGMVLSRGDDDFARDKAGGMLAAVYGIFRGSVSHSV